MIQTHIATRKEQRCSECSRRIPIGDRYFYNPDGKTREHTNCLEYAIEPVIHPMDTRKGGRYTLRPWGSDTYKQWPR